MIGNTLSHYRIEAELGRGGMGVVYRAIDEQLGRPVALKVLAPHLLEDASQRRRFLQEARSTAAVSHPYVANLHEVGEAGEHLFLVMELVEGETLGTCIAEGSINQEDRLRIALEIVEGLASAHERGVVHRDLKPENIIITPDGHPKILDFGLAKLHTQPTPQADDDATIAGTILDITLQGQIVGTPAYMAPEQARGDDVDHRSDIFSVGVVIYELMTGESPFRGRTPIDTLSSVLNKTPPRPSEVAKESERPLDRVVLRCLEKDPADRYESARDLAAALREAQRGGGGSIEFRLPGAKPLALAAVAILLLAVGIGWWRSQSGNPVLDIFDAEAAGPNWILVAELEGLPEKPHVLTAARELLLASLQQSKLVTPISRAQLRRGLQLAGMPQDTLVTPEIARELAFRASARTYIEGRIDQIGQSFNIVLHVADAESGNLLTSVNGLAKDESQLIPQLDDLGRELRRNLSENTEALGSTRLLVELFTESFDAYRLYLSAIQASERRDHRAAVDLLRDAVELDPEFAMAWYSMGLAYWNLGQADSSGVYLEKARSYPDRFAKQQQLMADAMFAYTGEWKLDESLALYTQLVQEEPNGSVHHKNLSTIYFALGQYEESLAAVDRAISTRPFGGTTSLTRNKQKVLMQLARFDEAKELEGELSGNSRTLSEITLALATDPNLAAQLCEANASHATDAVRFSSLMGQSSLLSRSGNLDAATARLLDARAAAPGHFYRDVADMAVVQLWLMSDGSLPSPSLPDTLRSVPQRVVATIAAAVQGDLERATAIRAEIADAAGIQQRLHQSDIALAEGWIAAAQGDWSGALAQVQTLVSSGPGPWFTGRLPHRWLTAIALRETGDLAGAADAFAACRNPSRLHHDTWTWWRLAEGISALEEARLRIDLGAPAAASALLDALDWSDADDGWAQRLAALRDQLGS